jgi:hypothetical protein
MAKRRNMLMLTLGLIVVITAVLITLAVTQKSNAIRPIYSQSEYKNKPINGLVRFKVAKTDLPRAPRTMTVYELKPIASGKKEIERIARALGVNAPLEYKTGGKVRAAAYEARDGIQTYWYEIDGRGFGYDKKGTFGVFLTNLPDDEATKRIALEQLEKRGLLPEEAFVSGVGGIRSARKDVYLNRLAEISRRIGGFNITGPGMQISVYLGSNGELIGLDSTMKKLVPFEKFRVKTVEEALQDAKRGNNTVNLHSEVKDPTITKLNIAYYADPAGAKSKFLQPVYVFRGPDTCIYVPMIVQ